MPLDPELKALMTSTALPYSQLPVEEARRQMLVASQGLNDDVALQSVFDLSAELPERCLPVRAYQPENANGGGLVYFHGGGWVLGSIATHDGYCRSLAHASGTTVLSVDYRLAPEHPFPAAAEDAQDCLVWIRNSAAQLSLDPMRIGVGGDSAGGNLAAVAAQRLRNEFQLACQVLIYPIVDCDNETDSYRENAEGYMLTRDTMDWFWDQYLPASAQRVDPQASPLRSQDLRELPPALVLTAEYDPLRDEGEQYARRLADSGTDVELKRHEGMIHGFVRRLRSLKAARQALDHVSQYLAKYLC